jgi:predicted transglutaminase-like cysteine proteinase
MRSAQKLILAFTLALIATSAARAQDSMTRQGQQAQPFGFWQQETQHPRELTYKEWKSSDEAREFGRSEYSGKITNR